MFSLTLILTLASLAMATDSPGFYYHNHKHPALPSSRRTLALRSVSVSFSSPALDHRSFYYCDAGKVTCDTTWCMPSTGSCCGIGDGSYCEAGTYCNDYGCCPDGKDCPYPPDGCGADDEECGDRCVPAGAVCCDDGGYCDAGETCAAGGGYCSVGDGGDGTTCEDDEDECSGSCMPAGSVCCHDGSYCYEGEVCSADGLTCESGTETASLPVSTESWVDTYSATYTKKADLPTSFEPAVSTTSIDDHINSAAVTRAAPTSVQDEFHTKDGSSSASDARATTATDNGAAGPTGVPNALVGLLALVPFVL